MFVRWQSRRSSAPPWWRRDVVHWAAILVEADRVDGERRQQHIAYLGGIPETEISDVASQCGFWERVTRILDDLSESISADDRQHIEKAIAQKVPCPTEKQYRLWKTQTEAVLGQGSVTPVLWHWPCKRTGPPKPSPPPEKFDAETQAAIETYPLQCQSEPVAFYAVADPDPEHGNDFLPSHLEKAG